MYGSIPASYQHERENLDNIPSMKSKLSNSPPIIVEFTPETVLKKLNRLKITKSAGPAGYHPRILSELVQSIKLPLSIIFTRSYEESCLPIAWKLRGPHNSYTQEREQGSHRKLQTSQPNFGNWEDDGVYYEGSFS